jgi:hypothetical protein
LAAWNGKVDAGQVSRPGALDVAAFAGLELAGHRIPGVADVTVSATIGQGIPATARAELTFATAENFLAFESLRGDMQPTVAGEILPVVAVNPSLQLFGWTKAFVRRIGEPRVSALIGAVEVVLDLEEDCTNC